MFFVLHKHRLDFCWHFSSSAVKLGPSSFIGHLVLLVWRFFWQQMEGKQKKKKETRRKCDHRVDVSVYPEKIQKQVTKEKQRTVQEINYR